MWPGADIVRDAVHREKTGGETEALRDRETQREGGRQEVDRWMGERNRGTKGETEGPLSAFVRGRECRQQPGPSILVPQGVVLPSALIRPASSPEGSHYFISHVYV